MDAVVRAVSAAACDYRRGRAAGKFNSFGSFQITMFSIFAPYVPAQL
jgi:hypothetical protein